MNGIPPFIDIRSDTVSFPTQAMRTAMAEAEVGDDVYGDDPTVKKLEEAGAECMGMEASLFVPSGTFGNQLALFTWCPRGSEVLLGEECHIIQHEAGAASIIAGVQTRPVPAPEGILPPEALAARRRSSPGLVEGPKFALGAAAVDAAKGAAYAGRDPHSPATSLICLENAHSSGRAVPLAAMDAAAALAAQWKIPVHLDGARIFNAAAALDCAVADIARRASSVMFCLSKGLCAPVGSLLAGPRDFIEEARYKRKIMGGGMRQAGILAAAGLTALAEHPPLLAGDHLRARKLEQGLAELPGVSVQPGDINMVFFRWSAGEDAQKARETAAAFRGRGILINPPEGGLFRFVTHYWIGDKETEAVLAASREIFR